MCNLRCIAALILTVLGCTCCTSETVGDDAPATEESGPEYGASRKCRSQQAQSAAWLRGQVQHLTTRVLSEPDELHEGAAVRLRRVLGAIGRETQKACGDGRTPLVPLVELAYSRDDDAVDEPLLRQIVDAYAQWAKDVGQPDVALIVYHPDPCVLMRDQVQVSYEVHDRPESGGTEVWVELVLTSDWPEVVYVDHGGTIHATRTQPAGADRTYQWGGSSADTAAARPGRTSRDMVAPSRVPDSHLHLLTGGTVRVSDVYGSAYGAVGPCRISIQQS